MSVGSPGGSRRWVVALALFTLALGLTLAVFRDARKDETLYLREAATMADCLREGRWFGNEAVGVHGFAFKLPAALLFLAVGNSVYAATAVTAVLATLCALLAFRVLRKILNSGPWALLGTWMLVTNFQFILLTPTFNRDIPALLSMLLLIDALLQRRSRWHIGLVLLLILDTKEYMFFMCLPAIGPWIVVEEWMHRGGRSAAGIVRRVAARGLAAVLPAAAYAMLMVCTGLVPLNMFLAKVMGMVDVPATNTAVAQFRPAVATTNLWTGTVLAPLPAAASTAAHSPAAAEPPALLHAVNTAIPYIGKAFYPSFFSFDGIPKPVALPALAMSVLLFVRWRREGRTDRMALCFLLWVFLAILFAMAGVPRYMQPVFPLLIACFIAFLRDGLARPRFAGWALLATVVYSALGLYFEQTGLWKKVVVNGAMLAGLVLAYAQQRSRASTLHLPPPAGAAPRHSTLDTRPLLPLLFGGFTLAISLWHTCTHPLGQVRNWRYFGPNREITRVLAEFGPDDRFWLNDAGWKYLLDFHTGQRAETPEWEGEIKPWVPKKHLLRRYGDQRAFGFWYVDIFDLRKRIRENGLDTVGLVVSEHDTERFAYQRELRLFQEKRWLELDRTVPLKNKTLYVFRYIEM
jgi:hypothetical protein